MKHPKIMFALGTVLGLSLAVSLSASADRLSQFNELAKEKGAKFGVNPNFIKAIISVESAGRINAVSPKNAQGLMQLMPATAERMGVPRSELFDPERNMEAGVKYISYLNGLFNNNPSLVAAGYNAGEGAVKKYGGIPPYRETQNYAPAVVARFKLLEACGNACYTKQHMANPQHYLNALNAGQSVVSSATSQSSQPVVTMMQPNNKLASWLGRPLQSQNVTQPVQAQVSAQKPTTSKITTAVVATQPSVNVTAVKPKPRARASFVQVAGKNGFEYLEPLL